MIINKFNYYILYNIIYNKYIINIKITFLLKNYFGINFVYHIVILINNLLMKKEVFINENVIGYLIINNSKY